MNIIKTDNTGGFPLELETLERMQEAYQQLQAFGALAGDKTIISGCKTIGTTVTSGFVYLNSELIYFEGGSVQTNIIVKEEITEVEHEDGNNKPTYFKRSVCFGTGTTAIPWSDFKRVYPMTSALYLDKIDMYAGGLDNLPEGWHLCDGQNGTVDLRGRFIVGLDPTDADYNAIGKTGGEKKVTLTENQMPSHKHTGSTSSAGNHRHGFNNDQAGGDDGAGYLVAGDTYRNQSLNNAFTKYTGTHTHTITINDKGGDEAHENRPPFFTLAYIQFKGL
jgi:microcystin-dependent protein